MFYGHRDGEADGWGRRVFAGLNTIDWSSMHHAYGPATEVPDLIRGLVDADPVVRETALDAMYGAVHHQGDVYDCTLAAVPFLFEAAGTSGLPGRGGILDLLASIGGDDEGPCDDDTPEEFHRAENLVAAGRSVFLALLADDDPQVRAAAPGGLLVGGGDAGVVTSALLARLGQEQDPGVRPALLAAVTKLARRAADGVLSGVDHAAVLGALVAEADAAVRPEARVAALTELARLAPSPDLVPRALAALDQVYAAAAAAPPPAGFRTDTLIGSIRELTEQEARGRTAAQAPELVATLNHALGDQVRQRLELVTTLLHHPQWEARHDALRPAKVLVEGWRGPYTELVELIGQQLLDHRPRVAALAGQSVEHLGGLAGPAADTIAASLASAPRSAPSSSRDQPSPWIITWPSHAPTTGPTLSALARLGDPRALPMLRWALEQDRVPKDIGYSVGHLGLAAAELATLMRQRLRQCRSADRDESRNSLVAGLSRLGEAARPAMAELLKLPLDSMLVHAFGRLGPVAAEAAGPLRDLLADGSLAPAAAEALYRVSGDAATVLPVLARHLDGDGPGVDRALRALTVLGPAAADLLPAVMPLAVAPDQHGWQQTHAAECVWRITGDPEPALGVFARVWEANRSSRPYLAGCLVRMGAAAAPMLPAVRAETGRVRRSTARDHAWSSDQIEEDERLLRDCATMLAALGE